MIAICLSPTPDQPDYNKGWWEPVGEDPFDEDPVTDARWVSVDAFLANEKGVSEHSQEGHASLPA